MKIDDIRAVLACLGSPEDPRDDAMDPAVKAAKKVAVANFKDTSARAMRLTDTANFGGGVDRHRAAAEAHRAALSAGQKVGGLEKGSGYGNSPDYNQRQHERNGLHEKLAAQHSAAAERIETTGSAMLSRPDAGDFDESKHPRDERGRFGEGNTALEGGGKALEGHRKWTSQLPKSMGGKDQTWKVHYDKDPWEGGKPSAERFASVHEPIIKAAFEGKTPAAPGERKIAIMTMGAPASGKSSALHAGGNTLGGVDKSRFVSVDPDAIKEKLPEYKAAIADRNNTYRLAAPMVHEESSKLAYDITDKAIANGNHVIIDGTGRDAKSFESKMDRLKAAGYEVHVVMPHLDKEEGIQRLKDRAEHSGRMVPEKFARTAYDTIPKNFERLAHKADSFKLYDNSGPPGSAPRVVYEGAKGFGDKIHDQAFMAKFRSDHPRADAERGSLDSSREIAASNARIAAARRELASRADETHAHYAGEFDLVGNHLGAASNVKSERNPEGHGYSPKNLSSIAEKASKEAVKTPNMEANAAASNAHAAAATAQQHGGVYGTSNMKAAEHHKFMRGAHSKAALEAPPAPPATPKNPDGKSPLLASKAGDKAWGQTLALGNTASPAAHSALAAAHAAAASGYRSAAAKAATLSGGGAAAKTMREAAEKHEAQATEHRAKRGDSVREDRVARFDLSPMKSSREGPSGGLIVKGHIRRTGVLEYRMPDGSTRKELCHPDHVFDQGSRESFKGAPITIDHPGKVTPANWKEHAVGHVGDTPVKDGRFLSSELHIMDAAAIRGVKSGKHKEISCGYTCGLDPTPGEYNGEKYDAVQTNPRGNHVALGPSGWGRAGPEVRVHMDGVSTDYGVSSRTD